jgi:hypothetical protein
MITDVLHDLQRDLKAPKNQYNNFGKYKYRSCEDILEAIKPLLPDGYAVTLSDRIIEAGDRVFCVSTATLINRSETDETSVWVEGAAEVAKEQKGMQPPQITGSASSYARKYALNGLFLIDDTKDSDATNDHGKGGKKMPTDKPVSQPLNVEVTGIVEVVNSMKTVENLNKYKEKVKADMADFDTASKNSIATAFLKKEKALSA